MPYIFGAVSFALFIGCVIHAIRNDRVYPWIFILIFLPGVGSLLYLFLEILPSMVSARQSGALKRGVSKIANPNRDLKSAMRNVEMVGSADAKLKLAEEYIARGENEDAIVLLKSALGGVLGDDPALLYALARAQIAVEDGAGAQDALDRLQTANPKFVSADAHLLYARALELQGKNDEAEDEYEKLVRYFAGEEARCRYALLLQKTGQPQRAQELFAEIIKRTDGAPGHYRRAQSEWRTIAKRQANNQPRA